MDAGVPPTGHGAPEPGAEPVAGRPDAEADAAPAVQMLSVDARRVVLAGTIAFAVVFVALLPFWGWLGEHGHRVWLWTALAGWVLGAAAWPLIGRHSEEGRLG